MKKHEKVIRRWRMQPARPFGVHLWFDPSEESVVLLDEPTGFLEIREENNFVVDKPAQMSYLGKGSSVSGQAGSTDPAGNPNDHMGRSCRNRPALPLELKEF